MKSFWGDGVEVRLYTPRSRERFGPELVPVSLSYTTRRPGGCHGMSVSIEPVRADFWQPFAHVAVIVNHVLVWEGRVNPPRTVDTWLTGFSAAGYGFAALSDQPYLSTDTSVVTSGEVLAEAIANAAPTVVYGPSDDPAGTDTAATYTRMTVAAILDQMVAKGTAEGRQLDWFVWPRATHAQPAYLVLQDAAIPTTAHYHVDGNVVRDPRDDALWGQVAVTYTATNQGTATITTGNSTVVVTHGLGVTPALDEISVTPGGDVQWWIDTITDDAFTINASAAVGADTDFGWAVSIPDVLTDWSEDNGFFDRYGIVRQQLVNGGNLTTAAAEQFRDTQASLLGTRRTATTISRGGGLGLPNAHGVYTTHFSRVRADEWVWDNEQAAMLPIVATTVDPLAGTLEIACGEQRDDFVRQWREVKRSTRRRREGIHENSGARERR